MANTMKALQTVTVGAGGVSSVTFSSIPQIYTDLVVKCSVRSSRNATADTLNLTVNGGTTYSNRTLYGNGTSPTSFSGSTAEIVWTTDAANTANTFSNTEFYIPNYVNSNAKSISADSVTESNATTAYAALSAGLSSSTSAINSITLTSNTSNTIVQYSTFTLYGVFNQDVSSAPSTPTIGTATAGDSSASITFTGVSGAASYTMTSTPGSITTTGTTSPITVTGLTNGTAYTFKAKANNPIGTSAESSASNSVTPALPTGYYSIATSTVGAGGASSVTFSSISQDYTHLELRWVIRTKDYAASTAQSYIYFNGVRNGQYALHYIYGAGSSSGTSGNANLSETYIQYGTAASQTANIFGAGVTSILDYTSTSKNKTLRNLGGYDANGSGYIVLGSGLIPVTAALSTMVIAPQDGNYAQYTTFALYGIKG